jgi:hypothetical protein
VSGLKYNRSSDSRAARSYSWGGAISSRVILARVSPRPDDNR